MNQDKKRKADTADTADATSNKKSKTSSSKVEWEVKFINVNAEEVREKLRSLGGEIVLNSELFPIVRHSLCLFFGVSRILFIHTKH